ncbi:MAG TPA: hypothetical protein VLJ14_11845 [Ktedonobacterales bacterium]|nr:hypothetical protein [Ktedonobacterales bacterium]
MSRSREVAIARRVAGMPRTATAVALVGLVALALAILVGCGAASQAPRWQLLGQADGHTILSLARDPFNSQGIYAGATGGVVYRAIAGKTLTPQPGAGLPANADVTALVPDPRTSGLVYAATTRGLYVTTDNGDTWRARGSGLPPADALTTLVFAPKLTALFAGDAAHGVYRSLDAGNTWTAVPQGLPANVGIDALLWQESAGRLFAAVHGGALYASIDDGQHWVRSDTSLPSGVQALAALPHLGSAGSGGSGETLYAGTSAGIYTSVDGGARWSAAAGSGAPRGGILALAVSADLPGALYAGTSGASGTVYRSADGGRAWQVIAPGLSHAITSILTLKTTDGREMVYTGAGQLAVSPPISTDQGGPVTLLVDGLVLGLLLVLVVYIWWKQRQRVLDFEREAARRAAGKRAERLDGGIPPIMGSNGYRPLPNGRGPDFPGPRSPGARRSRPRRGERGGDGDANPPRP